MTLQYCQALKWNLMLGLIVIWIQTLIGEQEEDKNRSIHIHNHMEAAAVEPFRA